MKFTDNAVRVWRWIVSFNGASYATLCFMTLVYPFVRRSKSLAALVLGSVLSVAAFMGAINILYSRYMLPTMIPFVILIGVMAGDAIDTMQKKIRSEGAKALRRSSLAAALATIFLLFWTMGDWFHKSLLFTTNITEASVSSEDRWQYFTGPLSLWE